MVPVVPLHQVEELLAKSKAQIQSLKSRQRQIGNNWREDNTLRFHLIDEKRRFTNLLLYTQSLKSTSK
jgi:hypothetical protein